MALTAVTSATTIGVTHIAAARAGSEPDARRTVRLAAGKWPAVVMMGASQVTGFVMAARLIRAGRIMAPAGALYAGLLGVGSGFVLYAAIAGDSLDSRATAVEIAGLSLGALGLLVTTAAGSIDLARLGAQWFGVPGGIVGAVEGVLPLVAAAAWTMIAIED